MPGINPLVWFLLFPVRWYIRYFPIARGKGILLRVFIYPAIPVAGDFITQLGGGAQLKLQYRGALGLSTLLCGSFEKAELAFMRRHIPSASTVIDVGANVGLFSVTFGYAVGSAGQVLAFEPLVSNMERLRENIALNGLMNVKIYGSALGESEGEATLHLADDPAFTSTTTVTGRHTGVNVKVPVTRLDTVWQSLSCPAIAAIKLDVEGGELAVLKGGESLLKTCRPILLVEAAAPEYLQQITTWLSGFGYRRLQPKGFEPWNHLFIHPLNFPESL